MRKTFAIIFIFAISTIQMQSCCISTEDQVVIDNKSQEIVDLVLIYGGSAHRNVTWDKAHFVPYVNYTDRSDKKHWLFDGYLFLDFIDGKGKIFATGYSGSPATKTEWKALADYFFTPEFSVFGLEECINDVSKKLKKPSGKRKIIIGMPEPIVGGPDSHYKNIPKDYWGEVNGKQLDFTNDYDRIEACRWYIDYIIEKFNAGGFENIELAGFYWVAEETLHTKTILTEIGSYLSQKQYSFNWIPYWKTQPDYLDWKSLNFSNTYLQPNYFFNDKVPYSRLGEACTVATKYNLDLELEFDLDVFVDGKNRGYRLYDYLKAFRENDVLGSKKIAYYQDCDAIYQLYNSKNEKNRTILHDFCSFVLEHQLKYKPQKP